MEFRNPIYTADGGIDCEVNHPLHGWIPFTASSTDPEAPGRDLFDAIVIAGGIAPFVAPPVPTLEEVRAEMAPLSPRQIRLALASIDITEADVDVALAGDPLGMIEWKHATEFRRLHPLVEALGASFEITQEQIDTLWTWTAVL